MGLICDLRVGQRVTVKESAPYSSEWRGEFVVVMTELDYGTRGFNIGIASDDEIKGGYGWTDGWSVNDLELVMEEGKV